MAHPSADLNAAVGSRCAIHCELAPKLNLAAHESAFAVLRDLRLENHGDARLEAVSLAIAGSPPFLVRRSWELDRVEAGGVVRIADRELRLNGDYLRELNESVRAEGRLQLTARDGAVLADATVPIELLAPNEWGGAGSMP